MVRNLPAAVSLSFLLLIMAGAARSETKDPFDSFDTSPRITTEEDADRDKSATQLILEAAILLDDERLVDARTKLLRAVQKDPSDYHAHMMLAGYYVEHVGHFRLALRYAKTALKYFEEQEGLPPYTSLSGKNTHMQMLYLMSQVWLNLDQYEKSLQVLDQFKAYGYSAPWYPGSRAWVLMKLGRLEEAIKMAREGVLEQAEPGRTLNMLGILLSMHDEPENSLTVFREAIAYEFSMGTTGQPATPLNNSGEVYKEIFREDDAERSWLRATSLPDGCEHVLPSLNLAMLYIDELNLPAAKRAMDSFEACVAQYPLRNGEEHKALVALTRGRVAMLSGHPEEALKFLYDSLQRRQWFGKIGTSVEDLEAALFMSLGQAFRTYNAHLATRHYDSVLAWINSLKTRSWNSLREWWYMRKSRRVLSEDLNDIEDLNIRNTDSLLEYPTLGEILAGYPEPLLTTKVKRQELKDRRPRARVFYDLYRAERELKAGNRKEGVALLQIVLPQVRLPQDSLLFVHAASLLLDSLNPESGEYSAWAQRIMSVAPPALRNYGHKLPVQVKGGGSELEDMLSDSSFIRSDSEQLLFAVHANRGNNGYTLSFSSRDPKVEDKTVHGATMNEAMNNLQDAVFSQAIE